MEGFVKALESGFSENPILSSHQNNLLFLSSLPQKIPSRKPKVSCWLGERLELHSPCNSDPPGEANISIPRCGFLVLIKMRLGAGAGEERDCL